MRRAFIAAIACALLLSGCASQQTGAAEVKPEPKTSKAATPSATPSAKLPAVSLETSCFFLYGRDVTGPMSDAADIVTRFVANPDLSTVTQEELDSTISSLATASDQAKDDIKPFIDAQIEPLQAMADALSGKANSSVDFTAFKASGIELLHQCKPFLY